MRMSSWCRKVTLIATTLAGLGFAQDPEGPGRGVARISLINGDVSVRRGDSGDWIAAAVNAPLVVQDRISTGPASRTEVQFDWANMVRLGSNSEIRFTELEYKRYQLQMAHGTATYRVLRNSEAEVELSTPAASIRPAKKGIYRVAVREDGQTELTVRSGEVEVYTPRGVERLRSGKTMLIRGTASDPEFQIVKAIEEDDWDRWNERRDRDLERSNSYRYVHRDIYGAEDLDPYGRWVHSDPYGWVWSPRVAIEWAPYRHGRWVWEDWYGWTWVSYEPWGWAPYHYGRWFHQAGYGWCWYPGGVTRHHWRPALVAFVGFGSYTGVNVGVGFGSLGWVPLAPHEPYYPWYGRSYYGGYRSRSVIDNSVNINITNIYRNARVRNGVTAVNVNDFSRGRIDRPVRIADDHFRNASLLRGQVPVAPGNESLRLSDREAPNVVRRPEESRFFSRRQPVPVDRIPFEEQKRNLERISRGSSQAGVSDVQPPLSTALAEHGGTPVLRRERTRAEQNPAALGSGENAARGWRRFGEPPVESGGISTRTERGERPRAPESNGQSQEGAAARSWRRFGEPPNTQVPATNLQSNVTPRQPGDDRRGGSRSDGNRGWRTLGEANSIQTERSVTRRTEDGGSAAPRGSADGWSRFEGRRESPGGGSGRIYVDRGIRSEMNTRSERYSGARRLDRSSGGEAPRMSAPESIQIAPPIIRERSVSRSERQSSEGGQISRGYNGPAQRSEGGVSRGGPGNGSGSRGGDSGMGRGGRTSR